MALLGSVFIYLSHWGLTYPMLHTIVALASLFFLLDSDRLTWFWYRLFIGFFWFWWISLSLQHYGYAWGFPVGLVLVSLVYGVLFVLIAWMSDSITSLLSAYLLSRGQTHGSAPTSLLFKALGLLLLSYMHPFGFDWYKPELMFVHSYIGIEKWQFLLILLAMMLTLWRQNLLFLGLILLAYQGKSITVSTLPSSAPMQLVTTHTSVEDKWNTDKHLEQFEAIFSTIDHAIDAGKK